MAGKGVGEHLGWEQGLERVLAVTVGAIRTLTMEGSGPMASVYRPRSLRASRDAVKAFMRASQQAPGAPPVSLPAVTLMDYFGPLVLTAKTSEGPVTIYPDYRIVKVQGGGYRLLYHAPYLVIQRGRTRTYIKNPAWDLWFISNQWESSFPRR